MTPKKYYIIDLMLNLANECGILEDIDQFNKIRVLNSMVYLAIFQKYANNHRYDLDSIAEYFEFNDYETYLLSASCSRLKRFGVIDFEGGFIRELLPIDKTYIYTIVMNRNDIAASTIEIYQLSNGAPLESSERSITVIPKKLPTSINEPVKPKATTKPKGRIIKKNSMYKDKDFGR